MSYNSFSKPRFYTNSIEYLYSKGLVNSISPVFLSSNWHTAKPYQLDDGEITDETYPDDIGYYKSFEFQLSEENLLNDANYIMILGHNFNSKSTTFSIQFWDSYGNYANLRHSDETLFNNTSGGAWDSQWTAFNIPDYDSVPIIIHFTPNSFNNGFNQALTTKIVVRIISTDETSTPSFSGISIGNYYDLPYNPDLGIKKTISYDGSSRPMNLFPNVNLPDGSDYPEEEGDGTEYQLGDVTGDNIVNVTDIVNVVQQILDGNALNEFQSILADVNQDGNINVTDIVAIVQHILGESTLGTIIINRARQLASQRTTGYKLSTPSGRRSFDISYSYIGSDSSGQNYIFPRYPNNPNDINNLDDEDQIYNSSKNNLFTSVINKTIGSHIPFIFSLNNENFDDMMLARFTNNSFEATEQAPNVHNISFGIREVW